MAEWVSYAELKQRVSVVDLLGRYGLLEGLRSQRAGEELVGLCPFHQETRGSFHVSTTKKTATLDKGWLFSLLASLDQY